MKQFLILTLLTLLTLLSVAGFGQSPVLPAPTPQLTVQYRLYVVQESVATPLNFTGTEADLLFFRDMEDASQSRFTQRQGGDPFEPLINGANPNNYSVYEHSGINFQRIGCISYIQDDQYYNQLTLPNWESYAGNFKDKAINVFLVNAANNSEDGVASSLGGSGNKAIFLNAYKKRNNTNGPFEVGAIFAHEIGHTLGLHHDWVGSGNTPTPAGAEFTDMYYASNPDWCNPGPGCTNNFMGYNNAQRHMSPQQVDAMRTQLQTVQTNILATETEPGEIVVNSDETWFYGDDRLINKDLRVVQGATLTVESCVSFTEGVKVIVEKGAHLKLDGGHMSTRLNPWWHNDRDGWEGIKAVGNPSLAQTELNQAKVTMQFNATNNRHPLVAFAETGVATVGENDQTNQGGAIVDVNQADFYNNGRDIYFAPYDNPINSGRENNVSNIRDSYFTSDWRISSSVGTPLNSIEIEFNDGVVIQSSEFISSRNYDEVQGVVVANAQFDIYDCRFEEYYQAVFVDGDPLVHIDKYFIKDTDFFSNSVGVELVFKQDNGLVIQDCYFEIGRNPENNSLAIDTIGNHGILGYESQVNISSSQFNRVSNQELTKGVEIINSYANGGGSNLSLTKQGVTNSKFSNLDFGILLRGQNYLTSSPGFGTVVVCNKFINCERSIDIRAHAEDGGLSGVGDLLFPSELATNNYFDFFDPIIKVFNSTNKPLRYLHSDSPGEIPTVDGLIVLQQVENGVCRIRGGRGGGNDPKGGGDQTLDGGKGDKMAGNNDPGKLSIYPNPNSGSRLNFRTGLNIEIKAYAISNSWGQEVSGYQPTKGNTLELPRLKPGVYFINFRSTAGEVISRKYIQQ